MHLSKMPIIETPRCVLRPFTLADAEALNAVNSLTEVMRYTAPVEDSIEKTQQYLVEGPLADYEKFGYGRHACIHKETDKLIGFCGLKYLPDFDETDIGYRLLPDYWGKGLATETSLEVMAYAKSNLGLKRIVGWAMPDNQASINVFPKLGMHYEKNIMVMGTECVQYVWEEK